MRWILILFIIFGIGCGLFYISSPGGVVIVLNPPFRVEIPISLALIVLVLIFLVLHLLLRFFVTLANLPRIVLGLKKTRGWAGGRDALANGVRYYLEGSYHDALEALKKVIKSKYQQPEALGFAAFLSGKLHRESSRENYIIELKKICSRDDYLPDLLQSSKDIDEQNYQKVIGRLSDGRALKTKTSGVLKLYMEALYGNGNFELANDVSEILNKRGVLDENTIKKIRYSLFRDSINQSNVDLPQVKKLWANLPKMQKSTSEALDCFLRKLIALGDLPFAKKTIENYLNNKWDSQIILLYPSCCQKDELKDGLVVAEAWLRSHPDDPELLLVLGKLCLISELWGKAKNFLEGSLKIKKSKSVYWEMAKMADKTGQPDLAKEYYKSGLEFVNQE